MTLTFTGYDQSQEFTTFVNMVKEAQGFISGFSYSKRSPATIELTAYCPDQPELLAYESTTKLSV
jgi:hypothetical protein